MPTNGGGPCECGISYSLDSQEDCASHAMRHDWYLRGYPLDDAGSRILGNVKTYPVIDARRGDTRPYKQQFACLALVAQRETPQFRAGYYGSDDENLIDRHVLAALDGGRAIAFLLSEFDTRAWPVVWREDGLYLTSDAADTSERRVIQRIWVAKQVSAPRHSQSPCRAGEPAVLSASLPNRMGRPVHAARQVLHARRLPRDLLACCRRRGGPYQRRQGA